MKRGHAKWLEVLFVLAVLMYLLSCPSSRQIGAHTMFTFNVEREDAHVRDSDEAQP
jgi:hypothetical protein